MALTDLTRISTSGIATGTSLSGAILHGDAHFRGTQVGVTSALFDSSDNALEFNDDVKLKFGNSGDLQLFYDSTPGESLITHTGPGVFKIEGNTSNNIFIRPKSGQNSITAKPNAEVELFYNGQQRFETSSHGAVVTGILTASKFSGSLVGNTSNASGISTFYDLRVSNNLTVEGTTTTLDTNLIGVDRVEVGANSNSIVGVAITQSGTADIVNLFDGATKVVTVDDVGQVGINSNAPSEKLDVIGNIKATGTVTGSSFSGGLPITGGADNRVITASSASAIQGEANLTFNGSKLVNAGSQTLTAGTAPQYRLNASSGDGSDNDRAILGLATANNHFINGTSAGDTILRTTNSGSLLFGVGTSEKVRITSGGTVNIGGDYANTDGKLKVTGDVHIGSGDLRFENSAHKIYTASSAHTLTIQGGASNPGGKIEFRGGTSNNDIRFFTSDGSGNSVEKVRIGGNGSVGIGTDYLSGNNSVYHKLMVEGDTTSQIAVAKIVRKHSSASNGTYTFEVDSSAHTSNVANGGAMSVNVNSGRAFTINGYGRVGIGTDTPNNIIHATGSNTSTGYQFINTHTTSGFGVFIKGGGTTADRYALRVDNAAGDEIFRVNANSFVGINSAIPAAYLDIGAHNTGNPTLHVRNHTSAGAYSGNYGSEFRHSFNSANHAMLIHTQEAADARRVLDISDSNGIFATFTNGKFGINELAPSEKLQIDGDILLGGQANSSESNYAIKFEYNNHQFAKIVGDGRDSTGYGDIDFYTSTGSGVSNLTQRMSIRADGKIGIGIASPAGMLEVQKNGVPAIIANYNNSKHIQMGAGGSGAGFHLTDGNFFTINHQPYANRGTDNNLTERFRIASDGDVTVTGTGDPVLTVTGSGHAQLTLTSTSGTDHCGVNFGDSSDHNAGMIQYTNSSNHMQFHSNGTETMRLASNGSLIIYRSPDTASDGYSTLEHMESNAMREHVRYISAGASSATINLMRVRRHYWGAGFYKIWLKQVYYSSTNEAVWWLNGHGRNTGSYSPSWNLGHEDKNGSISSNVIQITSASNSSPGNDYATYVDVYATVSAYHHYIVHIEAMGAVAYSTDTSSIDNNGYALF